MKKQMTDDMRLVVAMMAEGINGDIDAFEGALSVIRDIEMTGATVVKDGNERVISRQFDDYNFTTAHEYSKMLRGHLSQYKPKSEYEGEKVMRIYRDSLLFDAPYDFDCFCRYIEWDREEDKKFYMPRRKQLLPLAKAMQRLEERKKRLLCISMPPGTGKTTLAEFFLAWIGGRHPELPNVIGSHSNSFLRGVYDEMQRIVGKHSEYLWQNVFPDTRLVGTNAKDLMLDLGTRKRFSTFEFSSIGSGNAGKIRAANLLYCDDLIDSIETALSRDRLDKIWQQYYTDYRQRKIGDCVELHIATRWSVHDVIGNLEERFGDDPDAEFIICPALDENDESNFDYPYGLGFTTKFYHEQREIWDTVSWNCIYMQQPMEREGQLFPEDELQRYFELPEGEPDAIFGVCDTKDKGTDFCSAPVLWQYGNKYYLDRVFFENYAPQVIQPSLVLFLCQCNPHRMRFESNSSGGKFAADVQKEIKAKGCRTKIETKWTQKEKETKIIMAAPWIIEHVLFRDSSVLHGDEWREYRKFMQNLTTFSMFGKNKNDDAPDSMAQFADYAQGMGGAVVEIVRRRF